MVYTDWLRLIKSNYKWILITLATYVTDRSSKDIVAINIPEFSIIPIIENFFSLTNINNQGAAFGMMQNMRWLLVSISILAGIFIIYFLMNSKSSVQKISLALILGGACGNLHDRIFTGSVLDFLDFNFGKYHFPTFNAADVFVVTGCSLLAFTMISTSKKEISQINLEVK